MRGFVVFSVLLVVIGCGSARAQTAPTPPGCDAAFEYVLDRAAWMEAQREIEVAETLILRPESVLALSCFKDNAKATGSGSVFGTALAAKVDSVLSGASLNCVSMANVWKTIRCSDADKAKYFPDFTDLIAADPRSCGNTERDRSWQDAEAIVYPVDFRLPLDGGAAPLKTYFEKMKTPACGDSAMIKTGLSVEVWVKEQSGSNGQLKTVEDFVCLAPGCFYNGSTCE